MSAVTGRRIHVCGASGSGKTTLARALAAGSGAPHVELDAIHHQPGWEPLADRPFRDRVAAVVAGDAWVVDGNYDQVRDLVRARADTVIFLDLPRPLVMRQLIWRTVRRLVTREELWNGNREEPSNLLSLDPEHNILLWSWTTHGRRHAEVEAVRTDPGSAHLRVVQLTSRRQVAAIIRRVSSCAPPGWG